MEGENWATDPTLRYLGFDFEPFVGHAGEAGKIKVFIFPPRSRLTLAWRTIDLPEVSVTFRGMKTDLKRRAGCSRALALFTAIFIPMLCGCTTNHNTTRNQNVRPAPYVASAEEIMQRDSVKVRARQLIDSGKYKDYADARRAAEKEYPPVINSDQGAQEAAYYYQQQRVKVQEKFEADLDKMKRKS